MKLKPRQMGFALVAALMLVLQAAAGAYALGMAASAPLDAFGNPLCITSTDSVDIRSGLPDHNTLTDCCAVACSMFSAAATDERATPSVHNPLARVAGLFTPVFDAVKPVIAPERSPGSPRSPPGLLA